MNAAWRGAFTADPVNLLLWLISSLIKFGNVPMKLNSSSASSMLSIQNEVRSFSPAQHLQTLSVHRPGGRLAIQLEIQDLKLALGSPALEFSV
jgi:hypothetical protein